MRSPMIWYSLGAILATGSLTLGSGAAAEQQRAVKLSYGLYGTPGLVDMPIADMPEEGTLSGTFAKLGDTQRTTLTFQILPRLSASFRYTAVANFTPARWNGPSYYDRSFDLRYQVLKEGRYRPAVTVGLQDFLGTGLYGGEYIVATKGIAPGLRITGGLGWGRFGSYNSIGSLGSRPTALLGAGGTPNYDRWFRGDIGFFGGVAYAPNDRLTFKAEYSSDAYIQESKNGRFSHKSPWNFGVDYALSKDAQLSLYSAYGSEIGAQITFSPNVAKTPVPSGLDQPPLPVAVRSEVARRDMSWHTGSASTTGLNSALAETLKSEKIVLEGSKISARRAVVRIKNPTYGSTPQAIGRTARVMSRILPASVEDFVIVPVVNGIAASKITIARSDLERLEHAPATALLARTRFEDAYGDTPPANVAKYPKFRWSLTPYTEVSFFDPQKPVRLDVGARVKASYELTPNLLLSGSVTKRLFGDLDESRPGGSKMPRVRTDGALYAKEGDPALEHLTLTGFGRLGRDTYTRVSVGYLERMYAGASAEVLWKPVDSRLALGAELNYVRPRDFDTGFGLRSSTTSNGKVIPNVNGHISAYYDFGHGFHGQLDVGRYLAGDYGATVSIDREFGNGWVIGAYATKTNVSSDTFGEGSFDKGIRFSVPLSWALGNSSRQKYNFRINSLSRDGGARVNVDHRLYEKIRDYHRPVMEDQWGRVWR